jgi:pimeloyl-ACP methyl ester carboxylesterase
MRAPLLLAVSVLAAACAHAPPPAAGAQGRERVHFVDGAAGKLRVSDGGAGGLPVVLVHGLGADLESWRGQLDHLRAAGTRALAYDQRGHGASERARDGVYTIAALAEDLDHVVRAAGLRRFVLVGHSMSGAVISAYASQHPEVVAGLVYVDAVGGFDAFPPDAVRQFVAKDATLDAAGVRAAYVEMLGPKARPGTRDAVLASVARMDPPAFAALRRSMSEAPSKAEFGRWRGPALAVETGAEPLPFSASAVLGLRRVVVPDVSHWLMMDDPAATNAALDGFLAGLPAAP